MGVPYYPHLKISTVWCTKAAVRMGVDLSAFGALLCLALSFVLIYISFQYLIQVSHAVDSSILK